MKILVLVGALLLVLGVVTNVLTIRAAGGPLHPARLLMSVVSCIVLSTLAATGALRLILQMHCDASTPCDYAGPLEGGLTLSAVWLAFYVITYPIAAMLIARLRRAPDRVGSSQSS